MNYSCKKCRGKHSIGICLQKSENSETKADENNDKKNDVNVTDMPTENSNTIVLITAVNFSTESNNVLLQTACAEITNERECPFEKVRILFDSDSQRSYLNEQVRKKSNLKTIRKERLFIKTFANDSSFFKELDVVEVKLKILNKSFNLEVLVMPSICTPIANQPNLTVSRFYAHLRHLNLAKPFDEKHMPIEMLIGIGYYHSFFLDEIIRGKENEPVAINSYLGWIASGSFKHASFPSADETNAFFVKSEPFSEVSNDNDLNDLYTV